MRYLLPLVVFFGCTAQPVMEEAVLDEGLWTWEVSVCRSDMPSSDCTYSTWQTFCDGAVVDVEYRECWVVSPDGLVEVSYSAKPVESTCDLYGRLLDTWDALARGLAGECL